MTSFWVILLTSKENWIEIKSDMATNEASMDVLREKDNEECVTTGRARNTIMNGIKGRGGLRSPAPNNPGRGLLVFAQGRVWRPMSSYNIVRPDNSPQAFGGESLKSSISFSPWNWTTSSREGKGHSPVMGKGRSRMVRTVNSQQPPWTLQEPYAELEPAINSLEPPTSTLHLINESLGNFLPLGNFSKPPKVWAFG